MKSLVTLVMWVGIGFLVWAGATTLSIPARGADIGSPVPLPQKVADLEKKVADLEAKLKALTSPPVVTTVVQGSQGVYQPAPFVQPPEWGSVTTQVIPAPAAVTRSTLFPLSGGTGPIRTLVRGVGRFGGTSGCVGGFCPQR